MSIRKDELELLVAAKSGDHQARNILFNQYLHLARKIWGLDDIGEAFITFREIVKNFDIDRYNRPTAFYTYLYTSWKGYQNHEFNREIRAAVPVDVQNEAPVMDLNIRKTYEDDEDVLLELRHSLGAVVKKAGISANCKRFGKLLADGFSLSEIRAQMGLRKRDHHFFIKKLRAAACGQRI